MEHPKFERFNKKGKEWRNFLDFIRDHSELKSFKSVQIWYVPSPLESVVLFHSYDYIPFSDVIYSQTDVEIRAYYDTRKNSDGQQR